MPTKTTVAEFRDFYRDETVWANDAWYEDLQITIDGKEAIDDIDWTNIPDRLTPETPMTISGGVLFRPKAKGSMENEEFNLETVFKRWRKAKTVTNLVVTIPNDKVEAFKSYLAELGGKVG